MSKVCFFQTSELSKATTFVKRCLWAYFHQAGGLQNEQSLLFSSFSSFRAFKSLHFCQRGLWVHFHQADGLQNEQSLPFQAYQSITTIWSKNVLKYCRFLSVTGLVGKSTSGAVESFRTSEANCGANVNNETFKCKTFVDKCWKKRSLGALYFPTKSTFFQVIQHSSCIFKKKMRNFFFL